MKVNLHRVKNLVYATIDNFFDKHELSEVLREVIEVERFSLSPDKTQTATNKNKKWLKTGNGVFLDRLYNDNRLCSAILEANRKIFSPEVFKPMEEFDAVFGFLTHSTLDTTLLNYYRKGQEYKPHRDSSKITAITFLLIGENSGGDFYFPDQEETVKVAHNKTVIFPSCVLHSALPTAGDGTRVSIAQFIEGG